MHMPLRTRHANMVLSEHPEGDAFAGAAYGEMHKSKGLGMVIGVVAGLATAGVGWGMMGAAGGLGSGSLGALAGGAMFAGGISTALGEVTGNKKLTKVGGILSLAGGVGSLAADGLAMAAGVEGAKLGGTAAAGWSKTMTELEGAFGSVLGQGSSAATSTISQGGVSGTTGLTSGAGGQGMTGGLLDSAMAPSAATVDGFSGAGGTGLQASGSTASTTSNLGLAGGSPYSLTGGASPASSTAPAAGTSKGILGNVMDFASTPAGMNLVGNTVQGMAAGDAAQQELDRLQQEYGDSRADLERELKNINFQYEIIDPNDPQAEQKRQAAKAKGVPTITLGVNPTAQPVRPVGITMQPNQMKVA